MGCLWIVIAQGWELKAVADESWCALIQKQERSCLEGTTLLGER